MTTREEIVAEAMTWIGTPYHSNAGIKGVGCDCGRLPLAVFHAAGLMEYLEVDYSPQHMLHQDSEDYAEIVLRYMREIDREQLGPGDFVLWLWGRTYSHGAIVIDPPQIIHAYVKARAVVLANMDRDEELRTRPARYFTFF